MPAAPDHWDTVAQDLLTHALGLTERARRCVVAAELIAPGVKVPAELAAFLGLEAAPPARRKGRRHVVVPEAPYGYKKDGTPRKRPAPKPAHQAAMNAAGAASRAAANGEPAHA